MNKLSLAAMPLIGSLKNRDMTGAPESGGGSANNLFDMFIDIDDSGAGAIRTDDQYPTGMVPAGATAA